MLLFLLSFKDILLSQPHGFCSVQEQKLCIDTYFLNLINDAKVNYFQIQTCILLGSYGVTIEESE